MPITGKPAGLTPLQRVLGFDVSEETYDLLDLREQLIIDLKIAGWSQDEIGDAIGLSQGWVSIIFRRIRFKLADSKLRTTLEIRAYYKDNHVTVPETLDRFESEQDTNY